MRLVFSSQPDRTIVCPVVFLFNHDSLKKEVWLQLCVHLEYYWSYQARYQSVHYGWVFILLFPAYFTFIHSVLHCYCRLIEIQFHSLHRPEIKIVQLLSPVSFIHYFWLAFNLEGANYLEMIKRSLISMIIWKTHSRHD